MERQLSAGERDFLPSEPGKGISSPVSNTISSAIPRRRERKEREAERENEREPGSVESR